jgi:hypothetical protein
VVSGYSRFTDGDQDRESLLCTGNHLFNPLLDLHIGKWPETLDKQTEQEKAIGYQESSSIVISSLLGSQTRFIQLGKKYALGVLYGRFLLVPLFRAAENDLVEKPMSNQKSSERSMSLTEFFKSPIL